VSEATSLLLVGATLMQSGALGAVLLYARSPWYPAHGAGARAWGTTLLADQQLAGVVMWVPAGLVYVAAAAWLFVAWLRDDERRTVARQASVRAGAVAALGIALLVVASLGACTEGGRGESGHAADRHVEGGDAARGREAIRAYGCGSCHVIPGVRGARGLVGPPLDHWADRSIIAGQVPNDPARLVRWITVPQAIEPGTAMPNMGVSDGAARDIAAYLYTLH
jgi:cytochrome c1